MTDADAGRALLKAHMLRMAMASARCGKEVRIACSRALGHGLGERTNDRTALRTWPHALAPGLAERSFAVANLRKGLSERA